MAVDGCPEHVAQREILRTVVGSGVHGIAVPGQDDHDEMGVFVEPPSHVLGLHEPLKSYVWRSQPQGVRSGPGDTDRVWYSLRHYLRLAVHGNPTVLIPLFAQGEAVLACEPLGEELRQLAPAIVSAEAGHRFLGYLHGQRERLLGGSKRNRIPNRPELVERYGYDTKYAAHALRLALQGQELMLTGRLTLPMPVELQRLLIDVKQGEYTLAQVLHRIDAHADALRQLLADGRVAVPERPATASVEAWSISAHMRHWWSV